MKLPFNRYLVPKHFYQLLSRVQPWFLLAFAVLFAYGFISGFFLSPADYQQGDAFRIIYFHVPSALLSMSIYMLMATAAIIAWIWQVKVMRIVVHCCAPIGMMFTAAALITGAIWGKPMWGTWWVWDARLTSELILLFLYLGVIGVGNAFRDKDKAYQAQALLAVVGVVNIPIIHYSVEWWFTLHQGSTLSFVAPKIATSMRYPLYAMILAFNCYFAWALSKRCCAEIVLREKKSQWVQALTKSWQEKQISAKGSAS